MDNRQSDGGYPLPHSPSYDDGCDPGSAPIRASAALSLNRTMGPAEPTHDEVGSFSMMTVSAVYPLVGSFSMKMWALFV